METRFGSMLSNLRHESGLNQRQLASELKISQALLSHYENGSREPGLFFVCKVCDFFDVTADFVLGRVPADKVSELPISVGEDFSRAMKRASPEIREAAGSYMQAAARRITAQISGKKSPVEAAVAAADMSEAELRLIRVQNEK